MITLERWDVDALITRAEELAQSGVRRLLGITGAPASGKSTLAEEVVAALGHRAVLVGMDGFHLADDELRRLDNYERKGAIDTFDGGGFVSMLQRVRRSELVYAPLFHRELEAAIAGSVCIDADVPLVVTEGNYLLVDAGDWTQVRMLLDECWFLDVDENERIERLIHRHMEFGRDRAEAEERAYGTDQHNAELILATREDADVVVLG